MCGIVGKLDFGAAVDETTIERMCAAIAHRGPDARGMFVDGGVGLGIQRLAVIDVAGGDQPIFNEDGSVVVVMNGEIYNFVELRGELRAGGHRFRTDGDTEVLVHLYEDHGERMVTHLRGMFAFALWDVRRRRLFCARDRVGKKPLFWSRRGDRVWFASELSALLADPELDRSVNPDAIAAYLALQYVPHPMSAFAAVEKLPPASTLTIDRTGERIERYWSLDYTTTLAGLTRPEIEERLRELILEATRIRLMSEVPLGAFLSGGIDSSAVVAAMAQQTAEPVKTFSIGFGEDDFDELRYARVVARRFGTDHHELVVEPHATELMPKLARHFGEPFADDAALPTFYLAELTSRHVTVALNGDGGDESFAGYRRYVAQADAPDATAERYAMRMSAFDPAFQRRLLDPEFASSITLRGDQSVLDAWAASRASDPVERMMDADIQVYLPGILLPKADVAAMAYSVEGRSPFLDHELMEFAAALPAETKFSRGETKVVLKSALRPWLPGEILDRPKKGFAIPLDHWFRGELRELPREILLDPAAVARGYFRTAEIERLIVEQHRGDANHGLRLWVLLQFELWHREVVESRAVPTAARATRGLPATEARVSPFARR